jgi:tetratricopeptide (TPR) repeat protein
LRPRRTDQAEEEEEDEEEEGDEKQEDDDEDSDSEESKAWARAKLQRRNAKAYDNSGNLEAAEAAYEASLAADPTDVRTLESFARFLHRRRGALGRAEAFFRRALQTCVPALLRRLDLRASREDDLFSSSSSPSHLAFGSPSATGATSAEGASPSSSSNLPDASSRLPLKAVVSLLLAFANFLNRAKGDIESALLVFERALEIQPQSPLVLSAACYFFSGAGYDVVSRFSGAGVVERVPGSMPDADSSPLSASFASTGDESKAESTLGLDGTNSARSPRSSASQDPSGPKPPCHRPRAACLKQVEQLFARALQLMPGDVLLCLRYAKLLKRESKWNEAELMYMSALARARGGAENSGISPSSTSTTSSANKLLASALCNYASFVYRRRKDLSQARELFEEGLQRFPMHKGLLRNYSLFCEAHPQMAPQAGEPLRELLDARSLRSPKAQRRRSPRADGSAFF